MPKPISDELLASWLRTLKPQTAKNYHACLRRLLREMGSIDCKALYEAAKVDPVATWKAIKKASLKIESAKVRLNGCYAARRFLLDQDEDMMLPAANMKQPELVKPPAYLTWDDAQAICAAASLPYSVAFRIMLSAGWGAGEFLQFNKAETWARIKANLAANGEEYFRFAFKGRKKNRHPFYSLIPMKVLSDAVALEAQKKILLPLTGRGRRGRVGQPLDDLNIETNRRYLESAFRTALKRAPIILGQGSPSLHELRDTFLTRAIQTSCSDSAANFVMGHVIDRLGYNKCDRDEKWLKAEIGKIHGPAAVTEEALATRDTEIKDLRFQMEQLSGAVESLGQWTRALEAEAPAVAKRLRKKMTSREWYPHRGEEAAQDQRKRHQLRKS